MFCTQCGKAVKDNDKFCTFCGRKMAVVPIQPNPAALAPTRTERPKKQQSSLFGSVLAIGATLIGIALGRFMGLSVFLLIIPGVIGAYLGQWATKTERTTNSWVSIIVWANLAAWVLPFLGCFTSLFSLSLSSTKYHKRNVWCGTIGIILSAINAALGVWVWS